MRHNFVNDIGDYAKYALLRALADNGSVPVRLGVIWYLTEHAEHNGDGRKRGHLTQDGWEALDPELLTRMRLIEAALPDPEALDVRLVESSGILPPDTVYFSEPMPRVPGDARHRTASRAAWFARARQSLADCDVVFVDPDNGLEVPSVPMASPLAAKYAAISELLELLDAHSGVVLYQHADRTPWAQQRKRICEQITSVAPGPLVIRSLRFGAFGARAFFCITGRSELTQAVDKALSRLGTRAATWDKGRYLMLE